MCVGSVSVHLHHSQIHEVGSFRAVNDHLLIWCAESCSEFLGRRILRCLRKEIGRSEGYGRTIKLSNADAMSLFGKVYRGDNEDSMVVDEFRQCFVEEMRKRRWMTSEVSKSLYHFLAWKLN